MIPTLFKGVPNADKYSCKKGKSEAIVTGVLAPHIIQKVVNSIKSISFAIMIDASNHANGNRKMFSIIIRYFNIESMQVQVKLLDFVENSQESAESIFKLIKTCLINNKLQFSQLACFCADNAPVNFGSLSNANKVGKNVFSLIREENGNT